MRTIKFRGKDIETVEWIYGSLIQRMGYMPSIMYPYESNGKVRYSECAVKRETVGQFTGLMDKNGTEIYEGDILKWSNGRSYVVKFWEGMFYASVEECNDGILGGFPLHALTDYEDRKCEIVGNIFDNPELLKGGEK